MPKEYLLTNGLGGYSSADVQMGNTRKYHGLLVSSDIKLNRSVVVSRLLEEFKSRDDTQSISTNTYSDSTNPNGHIFLESFKNSSTPTWKYSLKGLKVTKKINMVKGRNAVVVSYEIDSEHAGVEFEVRPLITYRSFHDNNREEIEKGFEIRTMDAGTRLVLKKGEQLHIGHSAFKFTEHKDIYRNFFYQIENNRGYPSNEDLFSPGYFKAVLSQGRQTLILTFEVNNFPSRGYYSAPQISRETEVSLATDLEYFKEKHQSEPSILSRLLINQADHFRISVNHKPSIIAGYHWFGDWGRDTFISFKGIYLLLGKFEDAKQLLLRWGDLFKRGLLPNRPFADDYNSVDAVFWYGIAVWEYFQATQDLETISKILPELESAYKTFQQGSGTMRVREDGMLQDTNVGKSATWMDANINGYAVTDRSGLAVEIQMLWYNFMQIILELKSKVEIQVDTEEVQKTVQNFEQNFPILFWDSHNQYFYDVIKPYGPDGSLRPNQVIGMSLPFQPTGKEIAREALKLVERELLTPVGLKTLNAGHPEYIGYYGGDHEQRDRAYHQGTIWPFLLGHYLIAYMRAYDFSDESKSYVKEKLDSLERHLKEQDLDYLPEIYSPEGLKPEGCISQAWSVATILEAASLSVE